ncbi:hypothetical protein [uncultured Shewanella sp.]|uniref:hypothetical protein n=1 Tax=uncultured Shewanella sp. TaxID=173975 RepID=UPI00262BF4F3|nr:hypothetical protein [uncultured Shewanella sp.]
MPNFVWNKMGPVGSAVSSLKPKLTAVSALGYSQEGFPSDRAVILYSYNQIRRLSCNKDALDASLTQWCFVLYRNISELKFIGECYVDLINIHASFYQNSSDVFVHETKNNPFAAIGCR